MRAIILFFYKNYFFFLFLLLELISIGLVVQNNSYQKSSFLNSTNFIAANIYATYYHISGYFGLKRTNLALSEENAKLRSQSVLSFITYHNNTFVFGDTLYKQQYSYLEAVVINNSVNKMNNYLTLNKGYEQGIQPEMGVVSSKGIVGIVKEVSPNFSTVISVLHQKFHLSAKLKRQGYFGSLAWDGNDYKVGVLRDIPSHVNFSEGDTVVTSGYSSIFPEGLTVGYLLDANKNPGEVFYSARVKFSDDLKRLSNVYIINNIFKEEQQNIESKTNNQINGK